MDIKLTKGVKFALLAALISGASVFYNKIVLVSGVDPLVLNILKNGGVGIVLSLIIFRPQNYKTAIAQIKSNNKILIILAIIGGSIPFVLFFQGLAQSTAIQAQLINKTLFIWTALLALTFLKEKLTPIQVAGYIAILGVNLFIGGITQMALNTASLMILAATLFWSLEAVLVRKFVKQNQALVFAWSRMFLGSIILIGIGVFTGKINLITQLTSFQILAILGSIIFLTGYVSSYYSALKLSPATVVTVLLILATPITNILSSIFITKNIVSSEIIILIITVIAILAASGLYKNIKLSFPSNAK